MKLKWRLSHKIVALTALSALVPVLVAALIVRAEVNDVHERFHGMVTEVESARLRRTVESMRRRCQDSAERSHKLMDERLDKADLRAKELGGLSLAEVAAPGTASIRVRNQFSPDNARTIELSHRMMLGSEILEFNDSAEVPTPIVDMAVLGVDGRPLPDHAATIFQRLRPEDEMVRVATTVGRERGKRALGAYIPKHRPNGTPVPVIATVTKGDTYRGWAFGVDGWYHTVHRPLRSPKGDVIGMFSYGIREPKEFVEDLREAIAELETELTSETSVRGHRILVLNGTGDGKGGHEVFARGPAPIDASQEPPAEVLSRVVNATKSESGGARVAGTKNARHSVRVGDEGNFLVGSLYYGPRDLVIVASVPKTGVDAESATIHGEFQSVLNYAGLIALALAVVAGLLSILLGSRLARPISYATHISGLVASGKLNEASKRVDQVRQAGMNGASNGDRDETSTLLHAVGKMTTNLDSLVGRVQLSGIQVTSSSTQIAASANQLEATVAEQASSTNEVLATTTQISGISRELAESVERAAEAAHTTRELADQGRAGLDGMELVMSGLSASTESIATKLEEINAKTDSVRTVVDTITKVADQTNLLSLNASIEAEKAGESGRGFLVVAREIRRLADQTAVATLDIERMVNDMRAAVGAGVDEMVAFSAEVAAMVADVGLINDRQEELIGRVQTLTPVFSEISEGMNSQAQGAEQIRDAIVRLTEGAAQTAEALGEFKRTASMLQESARDMQDHISLFQVSSQG